MLVSEALQPPQQQQQPPELNLIVVCSGGQIPTLTILKSVQRGGFRIVNENT